MKVFRLNVLEDSSNIRILLFAFGICIFVSFRKTTAFQKQLLSGKIMSKAVACKFFFPFAEESSFDYSHEVRDNSNTLGSCQFSWAIRLQGANKGRWWCQRASQVPCCSRYWMFEIADGLFVDHYLCSFTLCLGGLLLSSYFASKLPQ